MAKQTAPIQEVARLLDLVPYLSTHSHISLKELAKEFGITEKAMTQELTSLSMCGLPGYTPYELIEVYFDSGFVTINNHETLDIPRALTQSEIATLLIGLALMRDSAAGLDKLVAKIDDLTEALTQLLGSIISIEPIAGPEVSEINRAIKERRTLEFLYRSSTQLGPVARQVEPLSLFNDRDHTYLAAFCLTAQERRNFRLDRISEITVGETVLSERAQEGSLEPPTYEVELEIRGRRRAIAEALSLDEIPPSGVVQYRSYSGEWLAKMAIAFAPDLVIRTPEDIRDGLRNRLANILSLYRS